MSRRGRPATRFTAILSLILSATMLGLLAVLQWLVNIS